MQQACRLFAERGYAGTSLTDIADAVGLTRGAIYYYFKNKEALLEAIVRELTITPAREIEHWRNNTTGTASERMRSFIRMRVLNVLSRQIEMRMVEVTEAALPPDLMRRHSAAKRQILNEYSGIVRDGIKAGEFRPVDPRIAALSIIGMVNWTTRWFRPDRELSAEQVADQIAEMAVQSVMLDEARRKSLSNPTMTINSIRRDLDHLAGLIGDDDPARPKRMRSSER